MDAELGWAVYSLGYAIVGALALLGAKRLFDALSPYRLDKQLTDNDNPAVGLVLSGYLLGVAIVLCGLFAGDSGVLPDVSVFATEMIEIAGYGILAMICLFVSGRLNDRFVLPAINNRRTVCEDGNTAVAAVVAATYVASAFVISGGIYGSVDVVTFLIAFVLGQVAIVVYGIVYQKITPHDDQVELGDNANLAAGLGFAGHLIAFSLILFRALRVDPATAVEWTLADRAANFAYFAVFGIILLALLRVVVDRLFLPGVKLHDEITRDRNLNAGLLEGGLAIAGGSILIFCL